MQPNLSIKNNPYKSFIKTNSKWDKNKTYLLNKHNLYDLFNNEIPAIYLPNFASSVECDNLYNIFDTIGFDEYVAVEPRIGRIGVTQFEAKTLGKNWYFTKSKAESVKRNIAFKQTFNPLERLIKMLKHILYDHTIKIACEDNQEYFAGLVRQINKSALLHADFAPHDAVGWRIADVTAQLAFNLCLIAPKTDGECIVHDKQWDISTDEKYLLNDSYGYRRNLVKRKDNFKIAVSQGTAYLFNSRNFHEVAACMGNRVTMSCFIGLTSRKEILIWN